MSETETTGTKTNPLMIVLIVAVVVLAAGLGYMVWKGNSNDGVVELTNNSTTPSTGTTSTGAAPGMNAPAATVAFDPATATKVPSGTTPEEFVKAYHEAVIAGRFADAYKMLPLDKQKSYGDAASYEAQVKAYGITSYEMGTPVENGDEVAIVATQVTPQMPITYTWTLVKVGDEWFVKSRTMGGSTN